MRICMFTSSFLPVIGGLQYQVKWLAEGIAEQGEEVYLLTPQDANSYIDQKKNGFPKNINLNLNKNHLLNILKVRKAINEIKPDIIHTHSALPDGLYATLANSFKGIPLIITSHGADVIKIKEINYGYRLNPIFSLIIKNILKRLNKHVVVSDAMIKYALDAGSSKDKIAVIPNGIPPKENVSEEKVNEVREIYGISPDEKILLTFSGMRPIKGLDYLITAMPMILKEHPESRLIMACRGEGYEHYLEGLIKNLNLKNGVSFIGFVQGEEKLALMESCDVFCLPSLMESFGIVLLEAMQFEKPIVASDTGGISEVIENARTGILVPPKRADELYKAINLLLTDKKLRERIGKNAGKRVRRFDIRKIANSYISLYEEVTKK